jgi:hypothetical protein
VRLLLPGRTGRTRSQHDNKEELKAIVQMGLSLHQRWQDIPEPMDTPAGPATAEFQVFKKEMLAFCEQCRGKLFCALDNPYVLKIEPPTGCGWDAHPLSFANTYASMENFPAALFYKVMQRLKRILYADNFNQLDRVGPQQIQDNDDSQDPAYVDGGSTGGSTSEESGESEAKLAGGGGSDPTLVPAADSTQRVQPSQVQRTHTSLSHAVHTTHIHTIHKSWVAIYRPT